ncbi:hypothetical protein BD626DRAFT_505624 [Schizophyllum amplum]|uniref:Zn(2)-C6 fungal-type domain-containing protein n=1 Tax=Schizophyllum amplum TaxID=97359 RepID=A0A550C5S0_9AGAR|nr:hypothetical protein BD626DRAFT_505624 [Auriculariopsis ampla]
MSEQPSSPVRRKSQSDDPTGQRQKRRYGASCEACRRRKRRCDGKGPDGRSLCKYCPQAGIPCIFPASGEASKIDKAYTELSTCKTLLFALAKAGDDERERLLAEWIATQDGRLNDSGSPETYSESSKEPAAKRPKHFNPVKIDDEHDSKSPLRVVTEGVTPHAIIDKNKKARHPSPASWGRNLRYTYESTLRSLIGHACAYEPKFAPPTSEEQRMLLDGYFSWQNPRYEILSRPVLESSMRSGDQRFYSEFMLYALFSGACRCLPEMKERVADFAMKAHVLLAAELCKPSCFATVYGCLLLSANLAATGWYSQAWNMAGLAIRIFNDMGCDADSSHTVVYDNEMDQAERFARQRIYWSAYIWDKSLSLSLSRKPSLRTKVNPPNFSIQDSEQAQWSPFWSPSQLGDWSAQHQIQQPPRTSWEMTCFYHTCTVYQFLDEVIENIYEHKDQRPTQMREFVLDLKDRMTAWQAQVPDTVYVNPEKPPAVSPPPHILQFNLLIHTTLILLYRPFYQEDASTSALPWTIPACHKAAQAIHLLLSLHERAYPLNRVIYLTIYAAFCSATIDMGLISNSSPQVAAAARYRLELTLKVLAIGCETDVPGIRRSVIALRNYMDHHGSTPSSRRSSQTNLSRVGHDGPPVHEVPIPEEQLPARDARLAHRSPHDLHAPEGLMPVSSVRLDPHYGMPPIPEPVYGYAEQQPPAYEYHSHGPAPPPHAGGFPATDFDPTSYLNSIYMGLPQPMPQWENVQWQQPAHGAVDFFGLGNYDPRQ